MTTRIADALVLAFSEGVSLRTWESTGLLEREWALYRRHSGRYGQIIVATYGGPDDRDLLPRLTSGMAGVTRVALVCNDRGLPPGAYLDALPGLVAAAVGGAGTVVVRTNQMSGGDAALTVTAALRDSGKEVGLVARGGYLWSQFAAWESGPESAAAAMIAEREGRLCRGADVVVGTTRQMVDDLAWRHGLPRAKLAVVPNYILQPAPAAGAERNADEILFAGRLVPQKRIDRLLDATALLRADLRSRARLTIIGSGPLEAELRERATALGLRAGFHPRMPHEQLLERMRRCCVYAQTSAYEGHPKTVIEAMAAGVPVLVTDAPGLREVVTSGLTGLCVPPEPRAIAAGLESLLDDPALRRRLGTAAAKEAAERYGLDAVADLDAAAAALALQRGVRAQPAAC